MNVQAQMSGQVSGQVPTQPGTQLPLLSQQNGHPLPHIQNTHPDFQKARNLMHSRIFDFLIRRHPNTQEIPLKRLSDIAKRLEEGVYRSATSQEEYLNYDTLERRLQVLLKRPAVNNHNQQHPQLVNSSSSISTMIPTPGLSHGGNSNLGAASSTDASLIASTDSMTTPNINSRSLLTPNIVPSGGTHNGFLPNGYQGGNNMLSSVNVQRITSQMIPTPGFNGNNNNSYMNFDTSSVNNGISGVDSAISSQQQQQKQHVGGQNSRILHNLGSQLGSGIRSCLSKSYGFSNGALNNSHGGPGSNIQNVNVQPGASEAYMTANAYGDGYGLSSTDASGPGNFYGSVTSGGSMSNSQNLNLVGLQTVPTMNSPLSTHPSNTHGTQSIDQSEKINFQSSLSLRDNQLQSQQQQFQQQPSMYHQEFIQQHHQQKPQVQQRQHMVKKIALGQSQLASDLGVQVKSEHGMGLSNEILNSQLSEQFQYSQLDNSLRQNSQVQHHFQQNSQQVQQMLHAQQLVGDQRNGASSVSVGVQPDLLMAGQWQSQSQASHFAREQHVQEEFRQRIIGQDEAQCNNFSSEGPIMSQTVVSKQTMEQRSCNGVTCTVENVNHDRDAKNQIRWICFILHAHRCSAPVGKCLEVNCTRGQNLLDHMKKCNVPHCSYPRCRHTQRLFDHFKQCTDLVCPVCVHVKKLQQKAAQSHQPMESVFSGRSSKPSDAEEPLAKLTSKTSPVIGNVCELQPSLKRVKIEHSSQSHIHGGERFMASSLSNSDPQISNVSQCEDYDRNNIFMPTKPQFAELKVEGYMNRRQESPCVNEMKKDNMDDIYNQRSDSHRVPLNEPATSIKQEGAKPEKENDLPKEEKVAPSAEQSCGTKSGKPKIKGVSLTELFTPEQVREHIRGLRQWVGQSKAKAEKNQAMENTMSENSCQLCAVEKLTFEPPPIYCTPCGVRIKRNAMYYTMGSGETRHYFCIPCYNETRGDTILADGNPIQKARLEKKKNDDESEEWWVQCDKCEAWQHQICALFNGRRNDGGQAEYTCPNCYIAEVERGERQPLPQSAVLGAKDLPKTILSDHIEQRLFRRLKQERLDRARSQGKSYDEVPGAEALVVRVVSSVDKRLDVKERFLEIFQEENYPTEFPYKSKVVLLFQKIEGVEVCLFGMYVQEFGTECQFPNQRRVYLSYLDSVKYFRPEIKAITGEALRTFVYHEILIGYLEYCKNRGFTSCYIWACPPLKGEDYILYCHPEIQKTPKSDKLREWYLSMLRKAKKEDIVVDLTNLYDHFFVSNGECKAKVTASRLPYFDGDYWPGAAEDMIYQLRQEEDARKLNKKGTTKKAITKRALKASGQTDLSTNTSKDWLLMHKLGETISPMKEDFIMVHLQHACSHCCLLMVCGNRWVCNQCRNFELCDRCYEAEQRREEREKHPVHLRDKHTLYRVEIMDVPVDTKDKDEILESEFFDTRQAFLSLCQGNHYQYDTLRRAKHSSMMVLYHLHNPTAPAFVITCNICHLDIEAGQGWRCEVCPDYDVCNACYKKNGGIDHPHRLTHHPSLAERDAQNKEARQLRVLQLRKMLDLLIHASQCRSAHCQYPHCRKVKGLFRHGIQCKIRASGGCVLCKKMWYLLQLHARACKESECTVPRCRDLKEHMRRLQQQSDSRRRAAVMEMMRQRAAEVAGNAG